MEYLVSKKQITVSLSHTGHTRDCNKSKGLKDLRQQAIWTRLKDCHLCNIQRWIWTYIFVVGNFFDAHWWDQFGRKGAHSMMEAVFIVVAVVRTTFHTKNVKRCQGNDNESYLCWTHCDHETTKFVHLKNISRLFGMFWFATKV